MSLLPPTHRYCLEKLELPSSWGFTGLSWGVPLRGNYGRIPTDVLRRMPYLKQVDLWSRKVSAHRLLQRWIGGAGQAVGTFGDGLVILHRHVVVHAIEADVDLLILMLKPDQILGLVSKLYTIEDVIYLLYYEFPNYLPWLQKAFWDVKLWDNLKMWSLFSFPTLYQWDRLLLDASQAASSKCSIGLYLLVEAYECWGFFSHRSNGTEEHKET